jgi:hypothetical protein
MPAASLSGSPSVTFWNGASHEHKSDRHAFDGLPFLVSVAVVWLGIVVGG